MFKSQHGNALFLILLAIALFAALSYAVTQSGRAGGNIDREKQMIDQAVSEQCNASVNYAVNKLTLFNGCNGGDINYEIDDTEAVDKSCHVFDPAGGGAIPCGAYLDVVDDCDLESLEIGEKCPDADLVYAGTSGGNRLYTTAADQGQFSWNNGSWDRPTTGATSTTDGKANTDTLVALEGAGAPYEAAHACRGLGDEWYLPALDELNVLYTNRMAIGGFNTSGAEPAGHYWTSVEHTNELVARSQRFSDGDQYFYPGKPEIRAVRCVRR